MRLSCPPEAASPKRFGVCTTYLSSPELSRHTLPGRRRSDFHKEYDVLAQDFPLLEFSVDVLKRMKQTTGELIQQHLNEVESILNQGGKRETYSIKFANSPRMPSKMSGKLPQKSSYLPPIANNRVSNLEENPPQPRTIAPMVPTERGTIVRNLR